MVDATASTSSTRRDRWVSPSWFIGRRPPSPSVVRDQVAEELDGHPVAGDHPRLQLDLLELHEDGELLAHPVGGGLLEPQTLAVEAQRALEIGDADAEMGERERHGGPSDVLSGPGALPAEVKQVALVGIDPVEMDAPPVDGGHGQDGRGQKEAAGDVERDIEAAPEGTVGGRYHLVDDVGDGMVLGRGRLGLALVGSRW